MPAGKLAGDPANRAHGAISPTVGRIAAHGTRTERLIGESPAFLQVLEDVSKIAPLEKPVLIVGERGTGKELIAARLHYLSESLGRRLS